jgi:hypothetical protein
LTFKSNGRARRQRYYRDFLAERRRLLAAAANRFLGL